MISETEYTRHTCISYHTKEYLYESCYLSLIQHDGLYSNSYY